MEKLLLNSEELAELLGIAVPTLRSRLCTDPHTLPPRVILPAAPSKPLWRAADVGRWIAALPLDTKTPQPPVLPQPKRPRRLPAL